MHLTYYADGQLYSSGLALSSCFFLTHLFLTLSCGVFLVKFRHFGFPLAQTINWQSLLAGGSVAIQTWSIYKVYTLGDEENYCSKSEWVITRLYLTLIYTIFYLPTVRYSKAEIWTLTLNIKTCTTSHKITQA